MSEAAELLGSWFMSTAPGRGRENGQARKGRKSPVRMTQGGMRLEGTVFL